MSKELTLTISDDVYQLAWQIAQSTKRDIDEVVAEALRHSFTPFPAHQQRAVMLREIDAFKKMHPQLVNHYFGEYVAIFQGHVVDHDRDPVVLLERVRLNYPDKIVLRRKVERDPEPVLHFRSPRLEQ